MQDKVLTIGNIVVELFMNSKESTHNTQLLQQKETTLVSQSTTSDDIQELLTNNREFIAYLSEKEEIKFSNKIYNGCHVKELQDIKEYLLNINLVK